MALRDIADDNDELRELQVRFGEGYPYTYPFYYATGELRELSDPDE